MELDEDLVGKTVILANKVSASVLGQGNDKEGRSIFSDV